MLNLQEITLDFKQKYMELGGDIRLSFYRFPNIFMSKDCTYLKYAELEGSICILSLPPAEVAEPVCMFPLGKGDLKKIAEALKRELGCTRFVSLSKEMVSRLEAECPGMYTFEQERDDFDYLYQTRDLIELSGKKYHSKRNHISRFNADYAYEYERLDEQKVKECIPILKAWFSAHEVHIAPLFDERQAIELLMQNFGALGLHGGAIKINGKICACSIGEKIEPDTAHIIIEKADINYPGLYAVMNREFLAHEWSDTLYVNREEDMGIEGLRKSKLSYYPYAYNEVYNAYLK